MPWYPKAKRREIEPGGNDPRLDKVVGAILHVDAGNAGGESLYSYFSERSGGIESHFHIEKNGKVYQFRDTAHEADANWHGNSWVARDGRTRKGYVSIETQGLEHGRWTKAQLSSIKELLTWLSKEHGFRLKVPGGPRSQGVGYHVLFGAPGAWTPVAKSCPGPKRIEQFETELTEWMRDQRKGRPDKKPKKPRTRIGTAVRRRVSKAWRKLRAAVSRRGGA